MKRAHDSPAPAAHPARNARALAQARGEALECHACPLWKGATQTVFGEGSRDAPIMLVGKQPGDSEDRMGRPFVGPAGRVLDRALEEAGIDRGKVYVTNAVKHFKYVPRGKRRMHKKPADAEIDACHPWLERELEFVALQLVVALGATAARAARTRHGDRSEARPAAALLRPREAAGDGASLRTASSTGRVQGRGISPLRERSRARRAVSRFVTPLASRASHAARADEYLLTAVEAAPLPAGRALAARESGPEIYSRMTEERGTRRSAQCLSLNRPRVSVLAAVMAVPLAVILVSEIEGRGRRAVVISGAVIAVSGRRFVRHCDASGERHREQHGGYCAFHPGLL